MSVCGDKMWRWDQGRLTYFSIDKVRKISEALVETDGVNLKDPSPLRTTLPRKVGLSFAPLKYKIWRNYSRVFKSLGLASRVNGELQTTDLCQRLLSTGDDFVTYDEYLQNIAKIFYYPSPIFQGYDVLAPQVFPFCAVLKFLYSRVTISPDPKINLDEIFGFLIGNRVTGLENIPYYSNLKDTKLRPNGDESRQVREMLIFISQLSYLSWISDSLILDSEALANLNNEELILLATPEQRSREIEPENEIQNMYQFSNSYNLKINLKEPITLEDLKFTEGKKIRVSHLRTERNRKVIKHYFQYAENPNLCNICNIEHKVRYPWIENLIEVHHILPLSSPLYIDRGGTSIKDLVGLCPNCHRATHSFYRNYLRGEGIDDFLSEEHALDIYMSAKNSFVYM
jgi:hypothetical protein